ncbi:hypothetical protein [Pseudofrankia inefficax]|uniref:Uncharacterized protein n=1 Tax=Pseudofrankia inefficax (strain DSM 45817 / CECT 9037 / DDB 130130 / EuI1c) TaxID=298654 RepID=E3J9W9_PSEI1|nr:hypothetical protein [Pseudofrankia inefficax]ADP78531.1 hypothetical protein FraEuI1c_0448 [Pseudofrankia inefficax]
MTFYPRNAALRVGTLLGGPVLAAAVLTASPATAAPASPQAIPPILLAGDQSQTGAVDISPTGVVVGTTQAPPPANIPGGTSPSTPLRWLPTPTGYVKQTLSLPAGATSATVTGVTDLGEAGGTLTTAAGQQPVRWSVSGLQTTALGPPGSSTTTAVGPGHWAVETGDTISGTATLFARDGSTTALAGTPELAGARIVTAVSIGGPGTVLLGAISGVGMGTTGRAVVWRSGSTVSLPVISAFSIGSACLSAIQPDGSVAYSGVVINPAPAQVIGVHRGGVPGTEVALPTGGRTATLGCSPAGGPVDALASDGSVVGQLLAAPGQPAEAALWRDGALVPLGVAAGETATTAAAVASGGRVILVATTTAGVQQPYLWTNGVRVPLTLPAGWTLRTIVKFTDAGAVLGAVQNAAGDIRPVVWRTRG